MIKIHDGYYQDNLVKYECSDCGKEFIVGEESVKDCPPGFPVCPYCGQSNVSWSSKTENEVRGELQLGCIGIYIER